MDVQSVGLAQARHQGMTSVLISELVNPRREAPRPPPLSPFPQPSVPPPVLSGSFHVPSAPRLADAASSRRQAPPPGCGGSWDVRPWTNGELTDQAASSRRRARRVLGAGHTLGGGSARTDDRRAHGHPRPPPATPPWPVSRGEATDTSDGCVQGVGLATAGGLAGAPRPRPRAPPTCHQSLLPLVPASRDPLMPLVL